MSDLDHLDPALDRAFESLTRDLAHAPAPGAATAMSTVRKRRRTRWGAVALTTLVVAGGGVVGPRLFASQHPSPVTASPAELTAERLTTATDGWTGAWRSAGPDDFDAVEAAFSSATQSCAERLFASVDAGGSEQDGLGDRVFRSGGATAITIFVDYAAAADASAHTSRAEGLPAVCGDPVAGSGATTGTTYLPSTDAEDIWVAQDADKVAVLLMLGLDSSSPTEVVARVGAALVDALRSDESFLHSDGMTSVAPDESASGGTTSVSGPGLTLGQLRASAPGWLSELTDTPRGREADLPCVSQSAIGETGWSTMQQLADRGTVTMGGEQDATYALDSVEEALTTCSSTRWTTRRDGDGMWATSREGTVVMVAAGTKMALLEVADVSPPTAEQAAGVQAVLRRWVNDTVVSTEATPEP